jgi:hypothetical protein
MTCAPGQSSGASSHAQDPVCGTLTTVVRSRVNFLCIWLALVASVSKGKRRVWTRFPSAHAEFMGTNGFTALWERTRDRYNRAIRKKGDSISCFWPGRRHTRLGKTSQTNATSVGPNSTLPTIVARETWYCITGQYDPGLRAPYTAKNLGIFTPCSACSLFTFGM